MIPELSVVILCYRTGNMVEEFVNRVISEINEIEIDYEIILVGNYLKGDTRADLDFNPRKISQFIS